MISELIIAFTALFTLGFIVMWLCKPALRQQLEQPKYTFLEQLSRHEQAASQTASATASQLKSQDP